MTHDIDDTCECGSTDEVESMGLPYRPMCALCRHEEMVRRGEEAQENEREQRKSG